MSNTIAPKWAIYKGLYALIAVVLAGLGIFGVLSETEVNSLSGQLGDLVMIIGGVVSGVASGRTGPNSGNDRPVIDTSGIDELVDRLGTAIPGPVGPQGPAGPAPDIDEVAERAADIIRDQARTGGALLDEVRRRISTGE